MTKRAAVINDISGLGKCSLVAAVSVLSCLGVAACPLPTAVLSNQTGYDSFFMDDYTDKMPVYIEEWKKRGIRFDTISTGFLANERQVGIIEDFIRDFKSADTLLIVDPVMGDGGHIYSTYTPQLCDRVCKLALSADVITPNLTEASLLLGVDPTEKRTVEEVCKMASSLMDKGPSRVVITGVKDGGQIHNIVADKGEVGVVSSLYTKGDYSGTGDLFAAVVTAGLVKGYTLYESVSAAAKFTERATAEAFLLGVDRNDGAEFEKYLPMLLEELK